MSDSDIPEPPRFLTAPEPVIVVGMVAFLVASVVVGVTGWGGSSALTICLTGLGVGLFGTSLMLTQRVAARRGRRGAQLGLR
ncbi:DUF2530 domain-containing protein [Williamsia sterculiae]|uniref:DUF2530 domain-containing protein n=1 Tax=Williamsia sterculiae TaxID=1344003 RepID=A0A1N7GW33_9NOCA|nr:DUF2530 domain-containing protein [Williamsia sterculiae]SIS16648.1 Protein of unknown function [Williamsia sterculiae]